jgi:hypothetical protein
MRSADPGYLVVVTAPPYRRTGEEEALVERLRAVRDRGFEVGEEEAFPLALEVFDHLGSPDPELRDELGLTALGTWIVDHGRLSPAELQELRRRALGDRGIRFHLGASGDDTVFRRSFSLLVLAIVLVADKQRRFLDAGDWLEIADGLVSYCHGERDVRGFVPGHGWAHAVAHAADVADECATSRFSRPEVCERLLSAFDVLVARADDVFQAEEDERIGIALAAMLSTGQLTASRLRAFLDERDLSERAYRTNWKHILRSTYFRLGAEHADVRHELEQAQAQLALQP